MMKYKSRNLGLDLMRSIAILLVLLTHFGFNPWDEILLGGIGVEVFFILSGFLIGRILIRSFDDFNGFETIKSFWINRWFRTIPLYFLALIIQIILSNNWDWGYLYYFVFLQNNFYGISLYPISWSLVVEEWFYSGLPLLFLVFWRVNKKLDYRLIILSLILLILFKYFFIDLRNVPFTGVNGNPLLRFDSMLMGVGLSWINLRKQEVFAKLSHPFYFYFGVGGVIFIQYLLFIRFGLSFINDSSFLKTIYFPVQSMCIVMVLPFLYNSEFLNTRVARIALIRDLISWTSILSYSFYLFHQNIMHLVKSFVAEDFSGVVAIFVMYPICYGIYMMYEKPMTSLREKFNR